MERPRASHHPASSLIVAILAVAAIARAQSPALEWCGTFLDRERAFATDTVEIARSVEEWTPLWTPLARLAPSTFDPATHAAVRIILGRSRVDASLLHVAVVREEEGSVVIHYTQHAKRPSYPQTAMFGVGHNMVQPTSHAPPPIRAYLVRSVPKTSLPIVAKAWPNPFAFLISELKREHAARDVVDALQPLTNRRGSSPDEWSLSIDRGSASSTIRALAEAMKSREATIRRYAVEALIGFGRDAYEARVPLVDALRDPDELTRTAAADALGAIGEVASYAVPALGRALEDSSCAVRHSAVVALARMGTSSLPLKDKLIAAVSNPAPCDRTDVSDAAAWALSLFGYRVVPSVIAALPNSSVEARRLFVQVLGAIGPEAWESVPALITGLTDPDVEIRRYVVRSLGQIGPGSKGAVDGVARLLDDDDVEVRRRSATALGEIGAAASAAVPDLVAAIADPDATVRSNAIEALGRIGPESRGSIPELTKALADPWLRRFAVVALGRIGPDASTAVPILLPLLSDPSIQGEVAVALGGIGLASRDAIPALLELGKKNDSDVGAQAVLALGKIGVEALPALREALRSSRDSKRQIIVQAIGEIGPPARAALPELLDQLTDESIRLASLAAIARVASDNVKLRGDLQSGTDSQFGKNLEVTRSTAVSSIAAAGIDWLPLLIEKLRSPESFVRTFAANGIERMGTRANSAIPALVSALREESSVIAVAHAIARMANDPGFSFSPRRRLQVLSANPERERALREAAQSMGRLGPEVMPFLMSRLNDESPTVRAFAAHSLGAIGAAANSAVPALIAGLRDERVAPAFMEGLSDIGPAAAAKLLDAVRSGDPESKKAIFAALADLGKGAAFALPALIEGLRDSDNETRNAAMEAIVLIGGDAVPMLISALGDSRCREWAALSLHLIGPWSAPAVPALTDLLLDDDYRIVGHAADALRAIGSAAEPAVDAMCKRLDDSNPLVRRRALFALGALRGLAKGAVARIEAALKDPDGNVRKFAHDALYNIQQDR